MELSFREKKISPKIKKRVWILLVVFVAALVLFGFLLNYEKEGGVTVLAEPTLPTVTMEACGTQLNELHGYTREMDACYMRDAILPLSEDRILPLTVHTYGYEVKGASYEIRSLDTERKIAETEISGFTQEGEDLSAQVQIENLVEKGQEYLFILTLEGEGDQQVRYYTRIMLPEDCHEKECLEFARWFHDTALGPDYSQVNMYLETSADADAETLGNVTIQSTVQQVGWQGFSGTVVGEPVIEMKDMNSSYVSLVFYYQMQREDETGMTGTYQVEEYFKVRYGSERMYLLDYNRTMEQYLNESSAEVFGRELSVGVTAGDMHYLSNETGSIVSFVQAGELFTYDRDKQELTRVFSFVGDLISDSRASYREHNIRILNMDESGNMDFVVYGYMNRGEHEGECGVNLYHYDSALGTVEEQIFVAATSSYQILNAGFSDVLYKTTKDDFYIMIGGTLQKVNLKSLETEEIISGLSLDQYAVSGSGRRVAWITGEGMDTKLTVLNLETGEAREIEAPEGQLIRPLAFLDEDLVYGLAYESDVLRDSTGTVVYPMYQLKIVDASSADFALVKEYQKTGSYVMKVTQEGYTLFLDRAQKAGSSYQQIDSDTIKNSSGEKNRAVEVLERPDSSEGTVTWIVMADTDEEEVKSLRYKEAQMSGSEGEKEILMDLAGSSETYFAYVGGRVLVSTDRLSEAIASADAEMGIVVNNKQQYLWKRSRKTSKQAISDLRPGAADAQASDSAACISAMLSREGANVQVSPLLEKGETPYMILKSTLKEHTVLDLSGCTLSQLLYYVGLGSPVYARTGMNEAVLITGYDSSTVSIYRPGSGTTSRMGMSEAQEMFAAGGSVFVSYVETSE